MLFRHAASSSFSGAALLVSRRRPYADETCDNVQLLALVQLAFTYLSGVCFFDAGGTAPAALSTDDELFGVFLVGLNLLIFVLLGWGMCGAVRDSVREMDDMIHF